MSPTPSVETSEACLKRAASMVKTGASLRTGQDEWFAVSYFYAAYHTVRAALIDDPLFESLAKLTKVNNEHRLSLIMDDKMVQRHQGRVASGVRSIGINDLVRVLYPQIRTEYLLLHGASVDVRYNSGLSRSDWIAIESSYQTIASAFHQGSLVATIPDS